MNRKQSTRGLIVVMALVTLALILAACGGGAASQPTAAPTAEPTATPVPKADIGKVSLSTGDLPGGFDSKSEDDLATFKENLDSYDVFDESAISGFESAQGEQLILYVGLLKDDTATDKFNKLLDDPELVLKEMFPGSDLSDIEYKVLTDLKGIGDNSAALGVLTKFEEGGPDYIIGMFGFRRGVVAVMVFEILPRELTQAVDLETIMNKLDGQAKNANP